mgnify:CR=1 FL=1
MSMNGDPVDEGESTGRVRRDRPPMDEDARLASSDLEDCKEVWLEELRDYMVETKKRQNQVAQYFWASILVSSPACALAFVTASPFSTFLFFNRNATPKLQQNCPINIIPGYRESRSVLHLLSPLSRLLFAFPNPFLRIATYT